MIVVSTLNDAALVRLVLALPTGTSDLYGLVCESLT
jgi:hypothetical protein